MRVIIPAYRTSSTLPTCIGALMKSTNRSQFEVVVVDDGENGDLEKLLEAYPVRIVKGLHYGRNVSGMDRGASIAVARNRGAQGFEGDVLVFLDADVVVEEDTIEKLTAPLLDGRADASAGNYSCETEGLNFYQKYKQLYINTINWRSGGYVQNELWTSIAAIQARVFFDLGGFSEYYFCIPQEDTELGYRLTSSKKRIMSVPDAAGKHLKQFGLKTLILNDLRKGANVSSLSFRDFSPVIKNRHVRKQDVLAVAGAFGLIGLVLAAALFSHLRFLWGGCGLFLGICYFLGRRDLIAVYAKQGPFFLVRALGLMFVLDVTRSVALVLGMIKAALEIMNALAKIDAVEGSPGRSKRFARLKTGARLLKHFLKICMPRISNPPYVMFLVTSRCDARCSFCCFWREKNSMKNELTIPEIETMARSLGPILQITLSGGSPELRRDLPEIAEIFYKHCRPINMTLCMNGYHTDRILTQVERILTECPDQRLTVGFSLDGLGKDHDEIRGLPGSFERVVDSYQGLARLKKKHGHLLIHCGVVISELNYENVEETVRWAHQNLPLDMLKPTLVRTETLADKSFLSENCVQTYFRLLDQEEARLTRNQPISLEILVKAKEKVLRGLYQNIYETGRSPVVCSASRENISIFANGDVRGCEVRSEVIGNLRDYGMNIRGLWRDAKAVGFRKKIRSEKCGCYHHAYLSLPIFRTAKMWPRILGAIGHIVKSSTWRTEDPQSSRTGKDLPLL